jgi:biopolymer transport protein ExbD
MGRPKKRAGVKIDMTAMVDVAFLLLIFFMSTTQFKPPEQVAVTLPESSSEIKVPATGVIVLTVNKQGEIFIGDESGATSSIPKGELNEAILGMRSRRPTAHIIVKGDREADFGPISDVMDALQETETNRFNLMTEARAERGD